MTDFAADGTVVHSTDLNKVLKVASTQGGLAGTGLATGASSGWLEAIGTVVVTTNASGVWSLTFATAFPNGLTTAVATPGDDSPTNVTISLNSTTCNKTTLSGTCYTGTSLANTANVRINFIAKGS